MNESSAYVNAMSGRQGQLVSDGRVRGAIENPGTTFPFYLSIRIPGDDECSNYKPVEPSLSNGGSPVIKTLPTSMSSSGLR